MKLKLILTTEEIVEALFPNLPPDIGVALEIEDSGAETQLPAVATDGEKRTEGVNVKSLAEMSIRDIIVLRKRPFRDIEELKEVKREIEDILKDADAKDGKKAKE